MAEAATAVGIASFGIQVCKGLLTYCDGWKAYDADLRSAHDAVANLTELLALLKACLGDEKVAEEKKAQVRKYLQECHAGLSQLAQKSQELRKYDEQSDSFRQRALAKVQKAWYPVRGKNALAEARKTVDGLREQLELAVHVLQLDVSADSLCTLKQVATDASQAAIRTAKIEAQNERVLAAQQADKYDKIAAWLSPPDPWTNHQSARQRYEPQTGLWLLQSEKYVKWKAGDRRHLWLYGKAGCGKTVLCSTVIEDMRAYCDTVPNSACAVFYCSFSDNQKQSYDSLLRSLVVQLGWKQPGFATLVQAYEKPGRSMPNPEELEKILTSSIASFDETFILLDALDECPQEGEARQHVLEALERLSQEAGNLKILATSREFSDVRDSVKTLGADTISMARHSVDTDIQRWVSSQLSRDRKLKHLDPKMKMSIEETFSKKADGM